MPRSREQQLIDIMFQVALAIKEKENREFFDNLNYEGTAKWVSEQLKGCGFETYPCGTSWGVLK